MLTLEQIRQGLADRRPGMVASATGTHVTTVIAIRDGKNTNPTLKIMQALSDYLEGRNRPAEM